MASITGIVKSPVVVNTSVAAQEKKFLEAANAGEKPRSPLSQAIDLFQTRTTQANQVQQIADGVRNGKINAKEAEILLKGQQDVSAATQRAMADGKLTLREKIELSAIQRNTQKLIDTAVNNASSPFASLAAHLNKNTQAQASQLDKLATGIANGNITRAETGKLLGQQAQIADARGDADSTQELTALSSQLEKAGKNLERHSKPGTQLDSLQIFSSNLLSQLGNVVKG